MLGEILGSSSSLECFRASHIRQIVRGRFQLWARRTAERARWRPTLVARFASLWLGAELWACGTRRSASQVAAEPRRAAVRRDQGFPSCPPASYEPGFFSAMKLHRWLTRDGPPDASHGEDVIRPGHPIVAKERSPFAASCAAT